MEEKIICRGIRHNPRNFYISIASLAGLLVLSTIIMSISFAIKYSPFLTVIDCFFDNQLSIPFVTAALVLIAFLYVFDKLISQNEIIVTNKRIYGKAAFGRRVDLPLDAISAVGTGFFKSIIITTSSGKIKFSMMDNCNGLHHVISNLLIERQSKSVIATTVKQENPQSNADELKKFKELLDAGVITQEEFDTKKKQLLGL